MEIKISACNHEEEFNLIIKQINTFTMKKVLFTIHPHQRMQIFEQKCVTIINVPGNIPAKKHKTNDNYLKMNYNGINYFNL